MTTKCYNCKSKVKWHVRDTAAETAKVKQAIDTFLGGIGGGIALPPDPPNIAYFCTKCWSKRMGFTEEQVTGGQAPPAQTLATDDGIKCKGVSFATTHKAFLLESGEFHIGRVAFVYCHELVHWYSHNHVGFQTSPGKGYWGVNWDEMTTDYVSANIFPKLKEGENYASLTFYNNDFVKLPELMCRGFSTCASLSGFKKKNWDKAVAKVSELKSPEADELLKALTEKEYAKMAQCWLRWYFTSSEKLKPFLECFEELKTTILSNNINTMTLQQETEYQASCAAGLKRPTW